MQRTTSFYGWDGQYGPSVIVDICKDAHSEKSALLKPMTEMQGRKSNGNTKIYDTNNDVESPQQQQPCQKMETNTTNLNDKEATEITRKLNESVQRYNGFSPSDLTTVKEQRDKASIRFQVVVWSVGAIDVRHSRVAVKFRVTLFWNDVDNCCNGTGNEQPSMRRNSSKKFDMRGRETAIRVSDSSTSSSNTSDETIDVPPVSIINAESFDIIGKPEVSLLREDTKLMRWTCLYKASLLQEKHNMRVHNFPHDTHELSLKIGILNHRKAGARWDKNFWKLGLATEDDSQNSTRIPHGLIVDHVQIPEFQYDQSQGLQFSFMPLGFGSRDVGGGKGLQQAQTLDQVPSKNSNEDKCLKVSLKVTRESGYYDKNVAPLLIILNAVGVSVLTLDATNFFQRALLLLNITFVQIGIRMSLDSKLPSVGYEIKLQCIMNNYLYSLLFQVLESGALHFLLHESNLGIITLGQADFVDRVAASIALIHGITLMMWYYRDWNPFDVVLCPRNNNMDMMLPYQNERSIKK